VFYYLVLKGDNDKKINDALNKESIGSRIKRSFGDGFKDLFSYGSS
jgi:hypothetical protein